MKSYVLFFLLACSSAIYTQPFTPAEIVRWQSRAQNVTIIRDDWGIPHIYGKTDADVVFGTLYAQCEDDFARVEANYIDATGRMAEVDGEGALYHDLRARMFLDSTQAMAIYRKSPAWMKKLLDAFADGVNYYLYTHPEVQPRLLRRFQPWMPLTFSEGSIGGNISAVAVDRIKAFYEQDRSTSWVRPSSAGQFSSLENTKRWGEAELLRPGSLRKEDDGTPSPPLPFSKSPDLQVSKSPVLQVSPSPDLQVSKSPDLLPFSTSVAEVSDLEEWEPGGSNGFAIAPSKSATGNALLLINPHTSFYFRSELQMVSEQGLNAYGAVTWGQFFIYQGFNQHCGWMHTSSGADSMDEYAETVEKRDGKFYYKYGAEWRPVQEDKVVLRYKDGDKTAQKEFIIYRTHHGPVIGEKDGKWIAIRMMNEPLAALSQSYLRTKAKGYKSFNKTMKIRTNSSNNTVFADDKGNIAYWHGDFMPRRNPGFEWNKPVDGSNPKTDWQGLHKVKDLVQLLNPPVGWIQNCNSTPFTAAGPDSPDKTRYPGYMAPDAENYRGVNAVRVLERRAVFTLDTLIAAANDPYLAGFEDLIPALVSAFDQSGDKNPDLVASIGILRNWDKKYGVQSIATALAIFWAEKTMRYARTQLPGMQGLPPLEATAFVIQNVAPDKKVELFKETLADLARDFGTWRVAWGDINRFQRLTGKTEETFDDNQPSIPVGFTPSAWGSLAAFGARTYPGTQKRYGYVGNSFVAVVEFGPRLTARSVVSGGQASAPGSPHFTDQARMYCEGKFKEVRFYPEEVRKHAERTYQPGSRPR